MQFSKAEQALTPAELARAEAALGVTLPPAMRAHYLEYNGGVPVWPCWPGNSGGSPAILVERFISIWYAKDFYDEPVHSMPGRTLLEWAGTDRVLGQVPQPLLPFAMAQLSDYVCLRHTDGAIVLFDRRTQEASWVCPSFEDFMAGLQPDERPAPQYPLLAEHPYWGAVRDFYGDAQATLTFSHPRLGDEAVPIKLGEFDAQRRPSQRQLDGYAATYQAWLADMDAVLAQIEAQGFSYAQRFYASHCADHPEDLPPACPNCLSSAAAHMTAMQNPVSLRVQAGKTVRLSISYALDREHGIEFKFVAGRLRDVGGINAT